MISYGDYKQLIFLNFYPTNDKENTINKETFSKSLQLVHLPDIYIIIKPLIIGKILNKNPFFKLFENLYSWKLQ